MAALSYFYSEPSITGYQQDYDQVQAFLDYDPNLFEPNDFLSDPFSSSFDFSSNDTNPYPTKLQKVSDFYDPFIINEPDFLVQNLNSVPGLLEDYILQQPESLLFPAALPNFPAGPVAVSGRPAATGGVSAQSIAARQRRRKITEKTHELGKLVPGGQRMNTAEMLQAAYKYIKFLQAQVGILEFAASCDHHEENEEEPIMESGEEEAMEILLGSCLVQEKLYSSEKCLVSKDFVWEISEDRQIVECNPQLISIVKQEQH
ncbi:basic helix-loop-helix (bHLH) DNA-bindingsuperfamily protein [Striga asiatica]|uniref:Basic helix-loop-helix (BHLH) DNA-bindingsuperfamily protein n=1 Tax=Striga asiatica TaxID=4170 RepID=A0A5A7NW50_STRAF|nr:basic helix-loop-helix (bHLH) DNA-bindingsuperfamily protein [Striga asiatica]